MPTKSSSSLPATLVLLGGIMLSPIGGLAQGSLTPPPGPPGPVMKTLEQIEARTPVNRLPGAADAVHVITQPGNYYLTGDVVGESGKHGLMILTNDVRLDLNGFSVRGVPGSLHGISREELGEDALEYTGIEIQGGRVQHWGGAGISLPLVHEVVLREVTVQSCEGVGILLGHSAVVENCRVTQVRARGISAGYHALVRGCHVQGVAASNPLFNHGISVDSGMVEQCVVQGVLRVPGTNPGKTLGIEVASDGQVHRCVVSMVWGMAFAAGISAPVVAHAEVRGVAADYGAGRAIGIQTSDNSDVSGLVSFSAVHYVVGFQAYGIAEGSNPWVTRGTKHARVQQCLVEDLGGQGGYTVGILARHVADCTVADVEATGATTDGYGDGILTVQGVVERCSVKSVRSNGISVDGFSTVRDCQVHLAGTGVSTGSGVRVFGTGSRIEGCHVSSSPRGFSQFNADRNIFIRNISRQNTEAFQVGDPAIAPIINSLAGANAATNPLANIVY